MRCLVKRLPIFSVLLLLLVGSVESHAQEVLTIRGGSASHTGNGAIAPFTPQSFYFVGDGIIAASLQESGARVGLSCNPCAPGQTLKLDVSLGRFVVPSHGRAGVNGQWHFPALFPDSEFNFSVAPIKIPETNMPHTLTARFTMTGRLTGYYYLSPIALFDRQVEGQGVVRIVFTKSPFPDYPGYMFHSASYKFEARRLRNRKESAQPSRPSTVERQ